VEVAFIEYETYVNTSGITPVRFQQVAIIFAECQILSGGLIMKEASKVWLEKLGPSVIWKPIYRQPLFEARKGHIIYWGKNEIPITRSVTVDRKEHSQQTAVWLSADFANHMLLDKINHTMQP
jgi:hypothetical protein